MNKLIVYRIKSLDETKEKKTKAIINDNFISYFEDDIKIKYDYKTTIFIPIKETSVMLTGQVLPSWRFLQ